MKYTANITVMPLKELLDPQGKAVSGSLHNLEITGIQDVRIGKHIILQIEAPDEVSAKQIAQDACKRLLANPVMESFAIEMSAATN
ncbi:MAG: phosphoribosylformylglycinamidine synthase subunit PurS [Chitinophagaceae bacterium]